MEGRVDVTREQCLQARLLLGMTQKMLAVTSGVPQPSIALYERSGHLSVERVNALRAALETAGVDFSGPIALVEIRAPRTHEWSAVPERRTLLCWTQQHLAETAGLKKPQISRFEARGPGLPTRRVSHYAAKMRAALEAAGIEFILENGGDAGVRFRKSAE